MECFRGVDLFAGLEEQYFQTLPRKDMGGHAPGSAGADDNRIISDVEVDFRCTDGEL
jgi:hypothetical protein